jgi:hypothetical protein
MWVIRLAIGGYTTPTDQRKAYRRSWIAAYVGETILEDRNSVQAYVDV